MKRRSMVVSFTPMSFVIRCGTPDCDWDHKMQNLGEDQLRLYRFFKYCI